jgi:ABC-type antimicrobial peptide transport system ATPase subunit
MIALITAMQSKNIKTENFPPLSVHMWILFTHPMIILYGMNSQFAITALLIYQRFKMISQQLERIKYKLVGQHVKTKASSKSLPILLIIKTKIFSCASYKKVS